MTPALVVVEKSINTAVCESFRLAVSAVQTCYLVFGYGWFLEIKCFFRCLPLKLPDNIPVLIFSQILINMMNLI